MPAPKKTAPNPVIVMSAPPERTTALAAAERKLLRQAFKEWKDGEAYLAGNDYRYSRKKNPPRGKAPWSDLAKSLFADNLDFHRAATAFAETSIFSDPTQTYRFFWSTDGKTVDLRVRKNPRHIGTVLVTFGDYGIQSNRVAELTVAAYTEYFKSFVGRAEIEGILAAIDVK